MWAPACPHPGGSEAAVNEGAWPQLATSSTFEGDPFPSTESCSHYPCLSLTKAANGRAAQEELGRKGLGIRVGRTASMSSALPRAAAKEEVPRPPILQTSKWELREARQHGESQGWRVAEPESNQPRTPDPQSWPLPVPPRPPQVGWLFPGWSSSPTRDEGAGAKACFHLSLGGWQPAG